MHLSELIPVVKRRLAVYWTGPIAGFGRYGEKYEGRIESHEQQLFVK